MYSFGENAGTNVGRQFGGSLDYTRGPWSLGASLWERRTTAQNTDRYRLLGGSYDFKVARAALLLSTREDDLPDARGGHIIADIKSYEATINPLFLVSTEIHIQDMYFYFWVNNKKLFRQYEVLRMLISLASSTDRCERMVLHLNEEKFFTDSLESRLQEDLLQARRESGRSDLDITYTFEDRRSTHGRYIFSIKGGLQFDHGFDTDVRDPSKRNHVHWLSHSELNPLWDRYGI
jgi:hypothetical protein